MREIKFRAWNKETKQICDVLLVCFVNQYVNVLPFENLEGGSQETWFFKDIELMQFTGLYDKNLQPIYEGDIVRTITTYREDRVFKNTRAVYWDTIQPAFVLWKDEWGDYDFSKCNCSVHEVLGNIYENPKLLEDEND